MKKLLFCLLLAACSTARNVPPPVIIIPDPEVPPIIPVDTVIRYVHDTVTLHDTSFSQMWDTLSLFVTEYIVSDTTSHVITLAPAIGDSWSELQTASDYCVSHPGYSLKLLAGQFHILRPWIIAKISNGDYETVSINIEGAAYAKDAQPAYITTIVADFPDGFALGLQNNKGSRIKDIAFQGPFKMPNTLTLLQVDTLTFDQWTDGRCRDTRTSPCAGIVIDPFSGSGEFAGLNYPMYPGLEKYYLPAMARGGSTALDITGCAIYNFVVGMLITAANQFNGELINLTDSRIDYCKVAYAYSQAQSKANMITGLMCWGGVHTVIDGQNYGFTHIDASTGPFVDVMNVAGAVHQLFNVSTATFPFSAKRVYAESLFKIGMVDGLAGTTFTDFQIDFQNSDRGYPSPDFYYCGYNTIWTGCMLRLYTASHPSNRIVLDYPTNIFIGGSMSAPPVCYTSANPAVFQNVGMFYYPTATRALNRNDYDSRIGVQDPVILHMDRSTFNGWFLAPNNQAAVADIFVANRNYDDQRASLGTLNYTVGFVTAVKGDTVYLSNMGAGLHDGARLFVYNCKINNL